jgi:hypothetical protein
MAADQGDRRHVAPAGRYVQTDIDADDATSRLRACTDAQSASADVPSTVSTIEHIDTALRPSVQGRPAHC